MLIDVNDVAQGHTTKQTWNAPDKWIWSEKPVHEPLIDEEAFKQAQALLALAFHGGRSADRRA